MVPWRRFGSGSTRLAPSGQWNERSRTGSETWEPIEVTEPRAYLPGNDDYADRIGVRYVVCRVTG